MEPCSSNWKSQRLCNLVVPSDTRVVTSCGSCPCSKATVNDNPESFLSLKSDLAAEYPLVDAGSTAGGIPTFRLTITTLPVASPGPYSTSLSLHSPRTPATARWCRLPGNIFYILFLGSYRICLLSNFHPRRGHQ